MTLAELSAINWPADITPTTKGYPIPNLGVLPRTTTVIKKTLGLWPDMLHNWYANTERKAVLQAVSNQFEWHQGMTGEAFVQAVENGIGPARAAQREMEKAADLGTELHKAIQARLRSEMGQPAVMPVLSDGATLAFMAWEEQWEKAGLRPVRVEQPVWDYELGYAGTIDLLALNQSDELELHDWKSSKYLYPDHHLQATAYIYAARNWAWVTRGFIWRLPKTLENVTVEIKPVGEIYHHDLRRNVFIPPDELMEAFIACRTLYRLFFERS